MLQGSSDLQAEGPVCFIDIEDLHGKYIFIDSCGAQVEIVAAEETVEEEIDPLTQLREQILAGQQEEELEESQDHFRRQDSDQVVCDPTRDALKQIVDASDDLDSEADSQESFMLVDEKLANAYKAAQSGSITPLIKEELRTSIQVRRLQKGKEEIVDTQLRKRPAPQPDVSDYQEDEEKKRVRREKNKMAAQKCRKRKSEKADDLEEETAVLLNHKEKLNREIEGLTKEKEELEVLLRFHDASQARRCGRKLSEGREDDLVPSQSPCQPASSSRSSSSSSSQDDQNCYDVPRTFDLSLEQDLLELLSS